MNSRTRKSVVINVAWLAGVAASLALLSWGSVRQLDSSKAAVATLGRDVASRQSLLAEQLANAAATDAIEDNQALVADWGEMIRSESERVGELSRAARHSGVQLVEMRSSTPRPSLDGHTIRCTHALGIVGEYREIAQFLDSVFELRGMVGVDEVTIEKTGTPSELHASMLLSWYAVGPGPASTEEEG